MTSTDAPSGQDRRTAIVAVSDDDLSGRDLSGVDLSGRDLSGVDLSGRDLSGVDLSGRDLSGVDLSGADLSGARLIGTVLAEATMVEVDLSNAQLLGAVMTKADLHGAHAPNAVFGRADLTGAVLFNATLEGASLSHTDLTGADLRVANLKGARLREAVLAGADMSRADMTETDMTQCDVGRSVFRHTDLSRARVNGLTGYSTADWIGVDILNVDFAGGYLVRRAIMDQNYLHEFRTKSRTNAVLYRLWWLTSDCGRSYLRWALCTMLMAVVFSVAYRFVAVDYGDYETGLSPMYYSVVTLTTLGYGDVLPASAPAQILAMAEVVIGYVMLGGLLSIFATKMGRRAE